LIEGIRIIQVKLAQDDQAFFFSQQLTHFTSIEGIHTIQLRAELFGIRAS
jgi:hypothetical protein